MKYNLYVNQLKAIELGIKNINQAIVFDLLSSASTWATPIKIDDKFFYWVSRTKVCIELELLIIKPDTVYRHFKALDSLGLIEYRKVGLKDCIALTELGKSYYSETHKVTMSEMNPNEDNPYVGNESEQPRNEIRNNSESNPIDTTSKDNTTNIIQARKIFRVFYHRYEGSKRLAKTEFDEFIKTHKDWSEVLPKLKDVVLEYPQNRDFIPHLKNYLRDRLWESAKRIKIPQWWDTKEGMVEKGSEFGLKVKDFGQFHQFYTAVKKEAKAKGEVIA